MSYHDIVCYVMLYYNIIVCCSIAYYGISCYNITLCYVTVLAQHGLEEVRAERDGHDEAVPECLGHEHIIVNNIDYKFRYIYIYIYIHIEREIYTFIKMK